MAAGTTMWWLYLVQCRDESIYTGIATDVARRLSEHRAGGARAARYLRGRGPLRLLAAQPVGTRGDALKLEFRVKRLPGAAKRQFARQPENLRQFIDDELAACVSRDPKPPIG